MFETETELLVMTIIKPDELHIHQNHLKGYLKHRFLVPRHKSFRLSHLGSENLLISPQVTLMMLGPEITL